MEIRKSGRYPAEKDDVVAVLGGAGRVRLRFRVCHRQLRTSLGRDVGENDPRHCCRASILRKHKKMPGLQNEVLAVWEKTEPMSDAYKQIDVLSFRRKRNPRPWPYLPP